MCLNIKMSVKYDILCDINMNFFLCIYCKEDIELGFQNLIAKELLARINSILSLTNFSYFIIGHFFQCYL